MNPTLQDLTIDKLARLEAAGYVGLLGTKYLSAAVKTPDSETGNRVRAINQAPARGWAIVVYGKPGEELKHKFLKDTEGRWHYYGVEKMETVH